MPSGRLVALDALDGVALEDEVPVGLGSFASRSDGRAHGHLHDGMQLPPLRDTVYARRRTQADRGDARASPNDRRPALFQAGAICGRDQWGGTTPLNARHPPSQLARRVWHLALWAGCRGVIGPEPSTSPDVERTCPRPPGSLDVLSRSGRGQPPRPLRACCTRRRELPLPMCRWPIPSYGPFSWGALGSGCFASPRPAP